MKQSFLVHTTVQSDGLSSRSIGRYVGMCPCSVSLQVFVARMQSLRRSLRQSFRQRRNTAPSNDRRKIAESLNLEAEQASRKKHSKNVRPRADSEPASPNIAAATGANTEADSKVMGLK